MPPSSSSSERGLYDWDYLCKFILIGDSSVGKSALLLRVTDDRFLAEEAEPTVGVEFGTVTLPLISSPSSSNLVEPAVAIEGSSDAASSPPTSPPAAPSSHPSHCPHVKVQIWDTSGSEAFRGITRSYYRGAAGCLLVYDVTHRPSFTNAKGWLKDVREHAEEDAVVVLVGNRVDLVDEGTYGEAGPASTRRVPTVEAAAWAEAEGILFAETSAKTGQNVREAFESCVREIHTRFTLAQASPTSPAVVGKSNRLLLKSRTGGGGSSSGIAGGRGRGSHGHIRLDQHGEGTMMGRNTCCGVM